MTVNKEMNQAYVDAVNASVRQKGRVEDINPWKKPPMFDVNLIDEASEQASQHVIRSYMAPFYEDFKPIAEEVKLNLLKHMESKGGFDGEFFHFVRNTSLPPELVLDMMSDLAEGNDSDGGVNG